MTIEEQLKDLILKKYYSVREFTVIADIPYTTMYSIFRRGIGNSSVNTIIKVCKLLGISVDALADGKIVPVNKKAEILVNERFEIKDLMEDTKDILTHCGFVTLDGEPVSKDGINSLIDSIDIGVELAKKKR
jgi:predicted transcriptional regulator